MSTKDKTMLTVQVTTETNEKLERIAKETHRTKSDLIRMIFEEYFERQDVE